MTEYLHNIELGILTFPLLAFLMSLPYALWQYRRYGSVPVWKTAVVFAFAFYLLCAFYMVVLPLPDSRSAMPSYSVTPQLEPFHFIEVLRRSTSFTLHDPATWIAALKVTYVYETLLNVALTMPLGAFLAYLPFFSSSTRCARRIRWP